MEVLNTVFSKKMENVEFTGLDFNLFFILMQSIDFVFIHGKTENGLLKPEEFKALLADGFYAPKLLDNIDDCYIDKKEEDEKPILTNHWAMEKIFRQ